MILFRQRYPRWWFDCALQSAIVTRGGAIPHIIVLAFLTFGAVIAVFVAIAGRYPRSLFDDVVGVGRWAAGPGLRHAAGHRPLPAFRLS